MALDAGNKIVNTNTGIVAAGKDIEGGYFTVASLSDIPSYSNIIGALCYVTALEKYYQYSEVLPSTDPKTYAWQEAKLGGGGSAAGAVRYDIAQTLTSAQKQQARSNIGMIVEVLDDSDI